MEEREIIQNYINRLDSFKNDSIYDNNVCREEDCYNVINEIVRVVDTVIPGIENSLYFRKGCATTDVNILSGILKLYLAQNTESVANGCEDNCKMNDPIVFISHSSHDRLYGDAIRNFLTGIGLKDSQIIYTSHPMNKIPLGKNIFDYLKDNLNRAVFVIFLWSKSFSNSVACMNEVGAAWVANKDYINVYVPGFDFMDPNYIDSAVDKSRMGIVIGNDSQCKHSLIELKDRISSLFDINVEEKKLLYLIDDFVDSVSKGKLHDYDPFVIFEDDNSDGNVVISFKKKE